MFVHCLHSLYRALSGLSKSPFPVLELTPSLAGNTLHGTTAVCRWVNLWLPMPTSMTPDSCEVGDSETLMDDEVFFGNSALVFGTLLGIFLVHVVVISAVEAYWLAEVRE